MLTLNVTYHYFFFLLGNLKSNSKCWYLCVNWNCILLLKESNKSTGNFSNWKYELRSSYDPICNLKNKSFHQKPLNIFSIYLGSGQTCSKIPSWIENALNAKIINGQTAPSPIPWQVHIQIGINSLGLSLACGGTILDEETILSAAHCFIHQGETIQYY